MSIRTDSMFFLKASLLEYQIVTKTYLPSDTSDISDVIDSSDISESSDSSDKPIL